MKRVMLIILLSILCSVNFSYANSNLFYPYVTFLTGSSPQAVAIGDVNGDGLNDVVMSTSYSSDPENDYKIFVFLQNQSGQLEPQIKYPTNPPYTTRSIDIGDVNHDGRADVVVGNCGSNIQVFLQNISGTLGPGISYPTINSCSIKIADLNNDGLLDVVGIGYATNSVDVFLQNNNGTLNPPVSYSVASSSYREVDVGDVNNDGLTDIVFLSGDGLIGILIQRLDRTFNPAVYYEINANTFTSGIAIGDVNSDTLQDIVVTYGGNQPDSKIGFFPQNTSGTLDPAVSYQSYDVPRTVVITDLDNDGKKDIIVEHGVAIGVYHQGEAGAILPEELYPNLFFANYNPQNLAVGDINGDGFNDVVRTDGYGLGVLYSRAGPAIPDISVSPLSISFGSVFLQNTSSQTVTIYNRGTGDLIINSIDIAGENGSEFDQTNDCSMIGSGSTCTVTAKFNATTEGEKNATLTITSNDPDTPIVQVTLFAYAGQPLFYPYVYFPIGSWPEAVAIGDVNGDGRNDVVMTTGYYFDPENDYHFFVFLQNSLGELNAPIKYPTNSSFTNSSQSIAIGDVNHDGRADVVVGNCGSNIQVFLQNASGSFDEGISYPTIDSCGIRIGDLNNDGLLDVVGIGAQVAIFLQSGDGTLNSPTTHSVPGEGPFELEVGDVNNDDLMDIIVMIGSGPFPNIGIFLQNPDGTFGDPTYYDIGGSECTRGVAIGDINGDGLNDVVVTFNGGTYGVGVFLQNNTGTLNPAITYPSAQGPEAVVIANVDGDGSKDVIVGHYQWLGVYLQGSDGTLMPEGLYPISTGTTHYNPQGLAVGDINGDELNDIVLVSYNQGLVVLYHSPPPFPPFPPTNVQASDGTYMDKVHVTWAASLWATSYTVYRATSSKRWARKTVLGTTSETFFNDNTAVPMSTYFYYVRASNILGSSDFSSYDTGYRSDGTPSVPTNVQASDGTHMDKVGVTWTTSATATSYTVYRATSLSRRASKTFLGTTSDTFFNDYTVVPMTSYYYYVTASNTYGTSDFSAYDAGYRSDGTPPIPTNVVASDGTYADKVQVTWTGSQEATSYNVYRATSTSRRATKVNIGTTFNTTYDDTTASVGVTYYYYVTATNSYGTSGYSAYDTGYR